jgi:hypothetical protein
MSNRKTKFKRGVIHNNTVAVPKTKCPNCGEMCNAGHYFPPSLGEPGFYVCTPRRYKYK